MTECVHMKMSDSQIDRYRTDLNEIMSMFTKWYQGTSLPYYNVYVPPSSRHMFTFQPTVSIEGFSGF